MKRHAIHAAAMLLAATVASFAVAQPVPPSDQSAAVGAGAGGRRDPMISRRAFVGSLTGCFLAALRAADAAPARKVPVVGYLGPEAESAFGGLNAFRQWLRDLGYVEGQTIALETRFTNGREDRALPLATELVQRGVDIIVARTTVSALAAKQATSTIPIVFTEVGDPVARGLVASIARPGGNATGLGSFESVEVNGKRLALLVEAVPGMARVAVLRYKNPALQELPRSSLDVFREAAQKLGVALQILHVQQPGDLEMAFAAMTRDRAGGLVLVGAPFFTTHRATILRLTAQHRLPAISTERAFAEQGGLMVYQEYTLDTERRVAVFVDKILKGAKPADLPVEQPTKFELVINLKTAKALGLTIPPSVLARADQVIE
jgi:putative ABC transport system substrate-binding protein